MMTAAAAQAPPRNTAGCILRLFRLPRFTVRLRRPRMRSCKRLPAMGSMLQMNSRNWMGARSDSGKLWACFSWTICRQRRRMCLVWCFRAKRILWSRLTSSSGSRHASSRLSRKLCFLALFCLGVSSSHAGIAALAGCRGVFRFSAGRSVTAVAARVPPLSVFRSVRREANSSLFGRPPLRELIGLSLFLS